MEDGRIGHDIVRIIRDRFYDRTRDRFYDMEDGRIGHDIVGIIRDRFYDGLYGGWEDRT